MRLVTRETGKGPVVLVATKLADACLWLGRQLHARFAVVPDERIEPEFHIAESWRVGVLQFCLWGDRCQFSQRRMERDGYCTRRAWEVYTSLLCKAGVIVKVPRSGVYWVHGWNRHRLRIALERGWCALPYPVGELAPKIFQTRQALTQMPQGHSVPQLRVWARSAPDTTAPDLAARLKPTKGK